MSVRVIFAAILVFHFSLQIEALPFFLSCRMDWNTCGGNTVAFEEILICKLANCSLSVYDKKLNKQPKAMRWKFCSYFEQIADSPNFLRKLALEFV